MPYCTSSFSLLTVNFFASFILTCKARQFARDDPVKFLKTIPAGAILDEIQNVPELTSYIQVDVDEKKRKGLYVLTGSRQLNMMETVT